MEKFIEHRYKDEYIGNIDMTYPTVSNKPSLLVDETGKYYVVSQHTAQVLKAIREHPGICHYDIYRVLRDHHIARRHIVLMLHFLTAADLIQLQIVERKHRYQLSRKIYFKVLRLNDDDQTHDYQHLIDHAKIVKRDEKFYWETQPQQGNIIDATYLIRRQTTQLIAA